MTEHSNLADFSRVQNGDTVIYSYTGAAVPVSFLPGKYRLKCYGAQGGYRSNIAYGGQGGYAEGVLELKHQIEAFIYVGGSGNTAGQGGAGSPGGGFNGGGARQSNLPGGGGATDIRLGTDSLFARVIVAGGGGSDGASSRSGGYGGGLTGGSSGGGYGSGGGAATQTAGGVGGNNNSGSFGYGGNGIYYANGYGGAGGGGWYGGGGVQPDGSGDDDRGGGGGSGYVLTADSEKPVGYLLGEEYHLTETVLSQGGRNGDGLIIIEVIEIGTQLFLARDAEGLKHWVQAKEASENTKIRYIRDWANGSSSNTSSHWVEIKAIDMNGENRALNIIPTSNGTLENSNIIAKITDGITETSNYAGFTQGKTYVEIDLGELCDIVQIIVWHYYAGGRTYYDTKLEASADGIKWVTLRSGDYAESSEGNATDVNAVFPLSSVDNGEWELIDNVDEPSEGLFLSHGNSLLPQSVTGLLDDAEILVWTDRRNIVDNPADYEFTLTADVTPPVQTITQTVPFSLPEGAAISRVSLVTDEQAGGTVSGEYSVIGSDITFTYTLEKPTADAVAGIKKINIYFTEG